MIEAVQTWEAVCDIHSDDNRHNERQDVGMHTDLEKAVRYLLDLGWAYHKFPNGDVFVMCPWHKILWERPAILDN